MTTATDCRPASFFTPAAKRGITIVIMLIIFLIESIGPFDMLVASFYIGVVAISGEAGNRRWILSVAAGSGVLNVLSFLFFHDLNSRVSLQACLATLVAVYVVAYLVLNHKAAQNELKFHQEILCRNQALFESTQRLSSTGSITLSFPSMDMEWSAEAKRMLGFGSVHSPLLSDLLMLSHADDHELMLNTIQGLNRRKSLTDTEFRINLPDRVTKIVRLVARPSGLQDCESQITMVLIDVTSARESEDDFQRRQSELAHSHCVMTFNEIVASIAHEVNQPLAAVVTSAQSGLRWLNRLTPDIAEVDLALVRVVEQTNRASAFMKNLREQSLDCVRVPEPVRIGDILENVENFLKRKARLGQIDVSFHVAYDTPLVTADRVQIQHVVMNLISNAIDSLSLNYSSVREVVVVASRSISGDLSVSVRDSGVGIRREDFNKLFTPFFTTKTNCVGIGLAICRSIIEAHGGRVWAGTDRNSGAIFNFSLPHVGKVSI